MLKCRLYGVNPIRDADRLTRGWLIQPPPRYTRSEPDAGPVGSVCLSPAYSPYQSSHHSHTFPCMSYRPQRFGRNCPTGAVNTWPSDAAIVTIRSTFRFRVPSAVFPTLT